MDAKNEERKVCPYKAKDKNFEHVFCYSGADLCRVKHGNPTELEHLGITKADLLYCDNVDCDALDKSVAYLVEGEGKAVEICRTDGFVDGGNSDLIKKIKESSFFKILEEEKLKEARKEAVIATMANFGSD